MFSNLSLGQYIPAVSLIHALDPRGKIIATFMLMLAVFQAGFSQQLAVLCVLIIILILLSRVNIKMYFKALKPFALIIVITMIILLWLTPGNIRFEFVNIRITVEGLVAAASLGIRFTILLLLARFLTLTTSPMAMTDAVERLLKPLRFLGFPVHELAMIMNISLRFIPLFFEEADRIRKAQLCRGANYQEGSLKQRIKKLRSIVLPIFKISLQRADELATAMELRGYQGGKGRTQLNVLRFHWRDFIFLGVLGIILLFIMF
ncbi:MAG: energy-coupling factor transporter transmembrane component T [Syntrophomonadaceae bacterium]|nr:energy-coupling factor transporter transmembrane component T [Syntrophomonadaceae bacterium]MDD3023516.1 energy-coupling factor transporter transmembrane component T [Syntrophomonadaceae bacterium]